MKVLNFNTRIVAIACYLLFLTACTSPFKTKEVITCPIVGGEKGARFELISTKRKNYSPFSWHVSDYTVPTRFHVFFMQEGLLGGRTELPTSFFRSGTLEREKKLDYCKTSGFIGGAYYFWHPIEINEIYVSLDQGESFTNIFPKILREQRESTMRINEDERKILWSEVKVLFHTDQDIQIEQSAHLRGSSCFTMHLRTPRCTPIKVRSTRTFDQGKTWTDPVIVDKPILFNLSSAH
jgi:hypothetical protein